MASSAGKVHIYNITVAGYEVALQELIEWLADAYTITQAELDAWPAP